MKAKVMVVGLVLFASSLGMGAREAKACHLRKRCRHSQASCAPSYTYPYAPAYTTPMPTTPGYGGYYASLPLSTRVQIIENTLLRYGFR